MRNKTSLLTNDEYYLWKKQSKISYPWERQYLNWDFLSYEKKRIEELVDWYSAFQKVDYSQANYDLILYAVPVELSSSWKAAVAEHNMNYLGLSALPNSPQHLLIGLLLETVKAPPEYAPIRITGARRVILHNHKKMMFEYALIIESWETVESDFLYRDIPFEKNILSKLLQENLINDVSTARSFQSPALSSPYVSGAFGGISLSSFSSDSAFTRELIKSITLLVPPEYRIIPPPADVVAGRKFQYANGIKFHFAERPYVEDNIMSGFQSHEYEALTNELSRRLKFSGEYSIFSSIIPKKGSSHLMKSFVLNFPKTEITFPKSIEDTILTDLNVRKFNQSITEEVWIQVVHARQLHPGLDKRSSEYLAEYANRLILDYDTILSETYPNSTIRGMVVRSMFHQSKYNLQRLAQSLVRAEGKKKKLAERHYQQARGIIVDNFSGLIRNSDVKLIISRLKNTQQNERFSVVQTELINNPKSTTLDLFNVLKSLRLFDDIYDLQKLLDWLKTHGYVVEIERTRYSWTDQIISQES